MGSSLGLYLLLRKLEKQVTLIVPNRCGAYLAWLPEADQAMFFDEDRERALPIIKEADLIFSLDYNHLHRTDRMEKPLQEATAKKVMVDHHLEPSDFDDCRYWDSTASATAELVYRLIEEMGYTHLIDRDIATCFYTGLVTDTGSFRYATTSVRVHRIVASLLDHRIDHHLIHERIYDNYSLGRMRLYGHCLLNKLVYLPEHHTAFIVVDLKDYENFHIDQSGTEGLVNYPLSMEGVVFAALIKEREDIVKISFRSKGNFPANLVAKSHFGGGGHLNAAGGRSRESLDKTLEKFESVLPLFREELQREAQHLYPTLFQEEIGK